LAGVFTGIIQQKCHKTAHAVMSAIFRSPLCQGATSKVKLFQTRNVITL